MTVQAVSTVKPNSVSNGHLAFSAGMGALAGAASRYVIPTKSEFSSIVNKDAVDTFVSNASTAARGANRSILKYGGVGALIAGGIYLLTKAFSKKDNEPENIEYTKLGALIDAPDYACEIMWYGEN